MPRENLTNSLIAPRWGVVATVREPVELVIAFACHHLAIGAERVFLFFDVGNDPAADVAETIQGVEVTRCDAAYWAEMGYKKPPALQTKRQTLNANRVMQTSGLDWLLHADADEFLWLSGPFAEEVEGVPEGGWLHVPNLERCWLDAPGGHLFEGAFRAPLHARPDLEDAIYGKRAKALSSGMGGHSSGKAIAKPGAGFMAIHRVREAEGGAELPYIEAPSAWMLHFDGITPRHWAVKNLRYAAQGPAMNQLLNRRRQATIGAILQAPNPEAAGIKVHQALFRLTPDEAERLEAEGLLHRLDLDIEGSVEMIAPHLNPTFSAEKFDRIHQAELEARAQAIVRAKRRAKKRSGA